MHPPQINRRAVLSALAALCLLPLPLSFAQNEAAQYFPDGILWDNDKADAVIREHFSSHLLALREPSLYPAQYGKVVYRFTWLRSFHNPMVFRLDIAANGTGRLTVKRTSGKGGYEPVEINLDTEMFVDRKTVDSLQRGLEHIGYWNKPVWIEGQGLDGARWIVEANANGLYKVVHRWTHTDPGFHDWCLKLVSFSGVGVGDVY